jgi:MYXO-CTERM domain-containing protein
VTCTALDQCHVAGTCDHATGACSNPAKADGTACDDGDANTAGDKCTGGICAGVDHCLGVTCTALDLCHIGGICDHATGACSNPAKPNGTACDDGNACTKTDVCAAGACGGTTYTCAAPDQCHQTGTCNGDGTCSYANKADGTACDDGNANTVGDQCTGGSCAGVDHCIGVTCTAQDECHDVGACDHATGACSSPAKADGAPCAGGTCAAGVCVASPVDAGTDGGPDDAGADGGTEDAGTDGGPGDGGTDGGGSPDGGATRPLAPSDCSCAVPGREAGDRWTAGLGAAALAALLGARRRRRG